MRDRASGVIAGTSNGSEQTQEYKSFIAKKMAGRRAEQGRRGRRSRLENKPGGPQGNVGPDREDRPRYGQNTERVQERGGRRGNMGRDGESRPRFSFRKRDRMDSVRSESTENKGNSGKRQRLREKKEAILANARKKIGINEEKRNEFQRRSRASQERRRGRRQRMRRMRQESGAQ